VCDTFFINFYHYGSSEAFMAVMFSSRGLLGHNTVYYCGRALQHYMAFYHHIKERNGPNIYPTIQWWMLYSELPHSILSWALFIFGDGGVWQFVQILRCASSSTMVLNHHTSFPFI